jgi:hypothetical protein
VPVVITSYPHPFISASAGMVHIWMDIHAKDKAQSGESRSRARRVPLEDCLEHREI